ncbi:putative signal peptide protein [Puccinia sorghi]|uniref:Putative signal peptide protein n=1 Tax=Puccinia sorghi TaxID=27349 RepID=A0A0L6V076_9BASI|nr:putative signal peptide protein [Puccinia sorghi]
MVSPNRSSWLASLWAWMGCVGNFENQKRDLPGTRDEMREMPHIYFYNIIYNKPTFSSTLRPLAQSLVIHRSFSFLGQLGYSLSPEQNFLKAEASVISLYTQKKVFTDTFNIEIAHTLLSLKADSYTFGASHLTKFKKKINTSRLPACFRAVQVLGEPLFILKSEEFLLQGISLMYFCCRGTNITPESCVLIVFDIQWSLLIGWCQNHHSTHPSFSWAPWLYCHLSPFSSSHNYFSPPHFQILNSKTLMWHTPLFKTENFPRHGSSFFPIFYFLLLALTYPMGHPSKNLPKLYSKPYISFLSAFAVLVARGIQLLGSRRLILNLYCLISVLVWL